MDERTWAEKIQEDHIEPMLCGFLEYTLEVGREKAIKDYTEYFKDLFYGEFLSHLKELNDKT